MGWYQRRVHGECRAEVLRVIRRLLEAKSVRLSSPLTEEGCGRAPGTPIVTLPVFDTSAKDGVRVGLGKDFYTTRWQRKRAKVHKTVRQIRLNRGRECILYHRHCW